MTKLIVGKRYCYIYSAYTYFKAEGGKTTIPPEAVRFTITSIEAGRVFFDYDNGVSSNAVLDCPFIENCVAE
jgi:hypothetical protein